MMCDMSSPPTTPIQPAEIKWASFRRRRHPAPAARGRQSEGDGPVPHRAHDGRPGSRARRAGVARGAGRQAAHDEALAAAGSHRFSGPSIMAATEREPDYEKRLAGSVMFERRLFHALFGTEDQKEHGRLLNKPEAGSSSNVELRFRSWTHPRYWACDAVRWQGATTLRAHAREEENNAASAPRHPAQIEVRNALITGERCRGHKSQCSSGTSGESG